jgi:anti-sigma regulatory factor (Ser/Thr protein kinase)
MHDYGKQPRHGAAALDIPGREFCIRCEEANSLAASLPVFQKIEDWMRVLGYPHRDLVAVLLSMREAVANAILHGHGRDPRKRVRLRYLVTPTEVLVEVQDEGHGFDPTHVPDALAGWQEHRPRGRGLFLMRSYTSWMCFNSTGNRVTLCRQRTDK